MANIDKFEMIANAYDNTERMRLHIPLKCDDPIALNGGIAKHQVHDP
ncbi:MULTISPECIES: hypothetical protein [Paenibacillus]|nr:hypothetical protein [Paenibacillus sp. IHBB 10380]